MVNGLERSKDPSERRCDQVVPEARVSDPRWHGQADAEMRSVKAKALSFVTL